MKELTLCGRCLAVQMMNKASMQQVNTFDRFKGEVSLCFCPFFLKVVK